MKKIISFFGCLMLFVFLGVAQTKSYPIPEYSNEIYLLKKDSTTTIVRLEKGSSKQEMKVKMMGMGGMDQGYEMDGEKSQVRLTSGSNLVFIFYNGDAAGGAPKSAQADSMMKANGMDPSMMSNPMASMMDPTQNISLYSMEPNKGKRKILLQSMGLMGKSKKTASKYTLSIKKVKDNYYEMIVDKSTLPKGEYSFVMMAMGSMDQSYSLFAFGVD